MTRTNVLTDNQLYATERKGNTLLVTFQGHPVGFGVVDAETELQGVVKYFGSESLTNVIVNLGAMSYVGTQLIGSLARLAEAVQKKDGVFAVCEPSHDTKEMFKALKLENEWPVYERESTAISKIVQEPLWQKLAILGRRRVFLPILGVVALAFVAWWLFGPMSPERRLAVAATKLEKHWEDYQDFTSTRPSQTEWTAYSEGMVKKMNSFVEELTVAGPLAAERYKLKAIVESQFIPLLRRRQPLTPQDSAVADEARRKIEHALQVARTRSRKKTG